jgi:hypothetical protein
MSEFPVPHTQDERHAIDGRHSNSRSTDPPIAKPTHQLRGGSPWGSLAVFGMGAGWGLAALGVVAGVERLLDSVAVSATNPVRLTSAVLGAFFCTLAFCLAGWAVAAITRMMASTFLLCLEHAERASESRSKGISQAVAQLERLVDSMTEHNRLRRTSGPLGLLTGRLPRLDWTNWRGPTPTIRSLPWCENNSPEHVATQFR